LGTHYHGPAREVRALDALIKLLRCTASVSARLEAGIREDGFTGTRFGLLEALLHLGPLEPCELGPRLLTSRPNVVLIVDQLEGAGLVRRTAVERDRRRVLVKLTPRGRRAIERAFARHVGRLVDEFSALSAKEQEELAHLCKRLGKR
jgi:MarR family transcriptional regulator, 2-MHQ and catechol-resistance regulon repressor